MREVKGYIRSNMQRTLGEGESWTPVSRDWRSEMTKQLRRLGAALATALLAVGVLGTAPAHANQDTSWGNGFAKHSSTSE